MSFPAAMATSRGTMAIHPVILCGGAGVRLWPASRPSRPKQFLDLAGERSLFQDTVQRVAPLAEGARLLVVAGVGHGAMVAEQLAELGVEATVLLEPEGRDSAPAMAAAAAWIRNRTPDGVALFVASDHHIPDDAAFRAAVLAAESAADAGRIVTFGVRPTEPSSAYGYIQPEGEGLAPVRAFVEKPDRSTAEHYVAEGFLWNSGNFMVRADVLLGELAAFAPEVVAAAEAALPPGENAGPIRLTEAFRNAPKISIDYAVMERSARVSVAPVDFRWSDLGAWDAVAGTGTGDRGVWVATDGDHGLVRAAKGMVVATAGISNIAIIAEPDAVLVCSLDRAQEVKPLVERLRGLAPGHAAGHQAHGAAFEDEADRFDAWMRLQALPLWATLGVDADGGFVEALDARGQLMAEFRRARVQARQAYVYAAAGAAGWRGLWAGLVREGLDRFEATNLRADGLYRTRVSRDGAPLDETASLYDQAFVLLAFAEAASAGVEPQLMADRAAALRGTLGQLKGPGQGWREDSGHPWQANAHMHLFEACLAWEAVEPNGPWCDMADEIAAMAKAFFIDPDGGFLREFFDADWRPAPGADGRLVEPGHQFEWAWLLTRWGRARGVVWAHRAAERLYGAGMRGIDPERGVAVDELSDDLTVRSSRARLWPQTEWLKAACLLAEDAGDARLRYRTDARRALAGLTRYLGPAGLWRDKLEPDGSLVDEPAPASSLYHIAAAWRQLEASRVTLGLPSR